MHNVHNCDFRYSNIANMFKIPPKFPKFWLSVATQK